MTLYIQHAIILELRRVSTAMTDIQCLISVGLSSLVNSLSRVSNYNNIINFKARRLYLHHCYSTARLRGFTRMCLIHMVLGNVQSVVSMAPPHCSMECRLFHCMFAG